MKYLKRILATFSAIMIGLMTRVYAVKTFEEMKGDMSGGFKHKIVEQKINYSSFPLTCVIMNVVILFLIPCVLLIGIFTNYKLKKKADTENKDILLKQKNKIRIIHIALLIVLIILIIIIKYDCDKYEVIDWEHTSNYIVFNSDYKFIPRVITAVSIILLIVFTFIVSKKEEVYQWLFITSCFFAYLIALLAITPQAFDIEFEIMYVLFTFMLLIIQSCKMMAAIINRRLRKLENEKN